MIELRNIVKSYDDEEVLKGVSLTLKAEQNLSVLGASGSGKSTLLRIIAGLVNDYSGSIFVNGTQIDHHKPKDRGAVYIYQKPLLFPHLTVEQNIAFGLRIQQKDEDVIRSETARMIDVLYLKGQENKYPHQLSGGQQQRVSFGRAFIIHPELLLLDEPFASLDPPTRREMQKLFSKVAQKESITSLFVTHDVKEALIVGDQFGIMQNGQLRLFEDKETFISDPDSGVHEELTFWNSIQS